MHRSLFLVVFLVFITMSSCFHAQESEPDSNRSEKSTYKSVRVIDNIPYRDGDSDAWRLDLALPENFGDKPMPAIVIIHGGGWRFGSKQDPVYRSLLLDYAFQGYVTASLNYRLVDEAPFPKCIEDVKCAVRWLRAHADEYNIDPERIGAYGHSAGAHLALMLAMCPPDAGLEGDGGWNDYSSELQAVAGGSTPTENGPRHQDWNKQAWWPIGYISKKIPPMLLIHGTQDEIVDVVMVDEFVRKVKDAGVTDIEYLRVEDGRHAVAYSENLATTKPAMDAFFNRTLNRSVER